MSGEGGDYEGINAYIPRTDNENDEVFVYNEDTKKIISRFVEPGKDRGQQRRINESIFHNLFTKILLTFYRNALSDIEKLLYNYFVKRKTKP